jgi:hypothetical protein
LLGKSVEGPSFVPLTAGDAADRPGGSRSSGAF